MHRPHLKFIERLDYLWNCTFRKIPLVKQEWRKLMNIFNYFQTISTHSLIFQKVHILEERSVKIKTKKKEMKCFHCDSNNLEFHRYSHPGFVLLKQSLRID